MVFNIKRELPCYSLRLCIFLWLDIKWFAALHNHIVNWQGKISKAAPLLKQRFDETTFVNIFPKVRLILCAMQMDLTATKMNNLMFNSSLINSTRSFKNHNSFCIDELLFDHNRHIGVGLFFFFHIFHQSYERKGDKSNLFLFVGSIRIFIGPKSGAWIKVLVCYK